MEKFCEKVNLKRSEETVLFISSYAILEHKLYKMSTLVSQKKNEHACKCEGYYQVFQNFPHFMAQ